MQDKLAFFASGLFETILAKKSEGATGFFGTKQEQSQTSNEESITTNLHTMPLAATANDGTSNIKLDEISMCAYTPYTMVQPT